MFSEPTPERSFPTTAVAIAAVAVVVLVAVLVMLGRRGPVVQPNTLLPVDAYADNLQVSGVEMSEAGSLAGGKSTYIDGHIANKGDKTVTGVTVQVVFANDTGMSPQIETVPLNLIRTREPYVDTQPMSAAPLAPGGEADFRLIFEDIQPSWNQQTPVMRAVKVSTR
jgi:hypothetical protein